ncbi:hypothetical protein VSP10_05645 [Myroides odoratimimus]|uniref:hypothetical protein n=1 Tax=Myroides odoratimimus TaxID=76832 RepID=UPI002DC02052|nr:hypothetical protein [Myroides odoratimimus]MEC4052270.1 hypothetical protein [Myroides odoratimimus]
MKKIFNLFLVLLSVFTFFTACSSDDNTNDPTTYKLKITTNPKETYLIVTFEEKGGSKRYEVEGNSELIINNYQRYPRADAKRISATVSNSPHNKVDSPYIKLELFKGKKLIATEEGSYSVQLKY